MDILMVLWMGCLLDMMMEYNLVFELVVLLEH